MLGGLGAVFELLGALGIKISDFPTIYRHIYIIYIYVYIHILNTYIYIYYTYIYIPFIKVDDDRKKLGNTHDVMVATPPG